MDRKIDILAERLAATDNLQEFNAAADFRDLRLKADVLKLKDIKKKIDLLIEKYERCELTEIKNALMKKCVLGDTSAIKLYLEYFAKPEVNAKEDDGLLNALILSGREVFKDEI